MTIFGKKETEACIFGAQPCNKPLVSDNYDLIMTP